MQLDTQIAQRLFDHGAQELRRKALAVDDILGRGQSGIDESLAEVAIAIGRQIPIEGQITAFGGDDDLIALDDAVFEQALERFADRAFAALMAIVDGGVDDVAAEC